jgi:YebC/PmpR family DNA-binding regulatory protein
MLHQVYQLLIEKRFSTCMSSISNLPKFQPVIRNFAVTGRHSKNVAAKKNKLDAVKSKMYTRLGNKILMAAKAGGTDLNVNVALARILKEAHSVKLPKENIDRILSKANDQSTQNLEQGIYELFGHGGVGLVVKTLTDSSNRAVKDIKALARKLDIKIASTGSVLFQFQEKAMLYPETNYNKDEVIEKAIELNLNDIDFQVMVDQEYECIITGIDQVGELQDLAQSLQIRGVTNLVYLPTESCHINEENQIKNQAAIEEIESLEDVDAVYHNMSP